MTDHSHKTYSEVFYAKGSDFGPCGFKIYHYDSTGNREIVTYRSGLEYRDKTDAQNAAADYCDAHSIDAEVM